MAYTNLRQSIGNFPSYLERETAYRGINFNPQTMPSLSYLLLARDVITDEVSKDFSAIRLFDTVFIPKGQKSVVYSFWCIGRIFLNRQGEVATHICFKLFDPNGAELQTSDISPRVLKGDIPVFTRAFFSSVLFEKVGKYTIQTTVKIGEEEFQNIGEPLIFMVEQIS
jgi:hypothetical protein